MSFFLPRDAHTDYIKSLPLRVNMEQLQCRVDLIAKTRTPANQHLCMLCDLSPEEDFWPPGCVFDGPYRICWRCVEKHGT